MNPQERAGSEQPMRKVIYDFGANGGDDLPYYLVRADLVVAVEANPELVDAMRARFADEIAAGRLVVEQCVVTAGPLGPADPPGADREVDFYVHRTKHWRSQFVRPRDEEIAEFTPRRLPARHVLDLIRAHGEPWYVKIDVEGYDAPLLRAIFAGGLRPAYVSAECHDVEAFLALAGAGGYGAFKRVLASRVAIDYADRVYECARSGRRLRFSFPRHSAGPFGNDVDGGWMTAESFMRLLAFEGTGWKDVHASRVDAPDPTLAPRVVHSLGRLASVGELLAHLVRRAARAALSIPRRLRPARPAPTQPRDR